MVLKVTIGDSEAYVDRSWISFTYQVQSRSAADYCRDHRRSGRRKAAVLAYSDGPDGVEFTLVPRTIDGCRLGDVILGL